DVGDEGMLEVASAEDQEPVEALAANAADPAFGVGARLRRSYRRFDDANAFGAEDLVELAAELAVAITDQKLRPDPLVVELHQEVARLLGHPAAVRIGGDPGEVHAASRQLHEEQDVEALQEERVDGEEVTLEDARRLRPQELTPALLEAPRRRLDPRLPQDRPDRARRQFDPEPDQLALDASYPQHGFSRASRTTSSRTSAAVGGRPGRRCRYVQRRATSSRCQRNSVVGATKNDRRQTCRGSTRLNAASSARSACVSCGRPT